MASATEQTIIKLAQELLLAEVETTSVTPAAIGRIIDRIISLKPSWKDGIDRDTVTDELIRRFSLWIGQDTALRNAEGHKEWLKQGLKRDWRYWQRYREWLERKLSYKAVEALDRSTDLVLALLENPLRDGGWDRRGLVVGHVQSGKTSHYSGLICKAADAGYKIIIVLAGMHNNLRSQTQLRLDEAFLGYKTSAIDGNALLPIGVGEIDSDQSIRPNYATNRTETGDFNINIARNLGITPEQRPWLFVVKKNKTVLTRLLGWVRNHVVDATDKETDRPVVTRLPLLLIDDEADNASVDTKEILVDENGKPDEDHEPTAINRLVRSILHSFSRSAHVGYTATPFANIFIHEQGRTLDEGADLFPEAFIISLAAPSNYVGPAAVFGSQGENGRSGGLPLVRHVTDFAQWMPTRHKNGHRPRHEGKADLPPSLSEAINSFLLSCALRQLRRQGREHCSMLVHVTRFVSVQQAVFTQIEERVHHTKQRLERRIGHEPLLSELRTLWANDFAPTTASMTDEFPDLDRYRTVRWEEVEAALTEVVAEIQVRMINGTAKDALDYADNEEVGLKVIAIGGDKLSRGLTLEGLTTSYFLRASKMYDTLMQMGRWFGYRPGYIDICRLYTTDDLVEWFEHIGNASEELRDEFDFMAASGATPREYGLKVQSHPVLMVTSRLKMRTARNLALSFSGNLLETVTFHREPDILQRNLDAARRLLAKLGKSLPDPERRHGGRTTWKGSHLWEGVDAGEVIDFLDAYRSHPEAHKVNSDLLAEFIRSLVRENELTDWTVALIGAGRGKGDHLAFHEGLKVKMLERTAHGRHPDRYSIGRLMSPRDEAIDLDEAAWNEALVETRRAYHDDPGRNRSPTEPDAPNGPAIRKVRPKSRGVLFLYVLDPAHAGCESGLKKDEPPVVGFAVSFPASNSGVRVDYKVNNTLWEQEFGASE